jgi:ADP-dependent phosphofructokinase/glucokinase
VEGNSLKDKTLWHEYLEQACQRQIRARVLAAFNTNIDAIVHVTGELMDSIGAKDKSISWDKVEKGSAEAISAINTKEDLLIVLKDCLGGGKSFHIVLENLSLLDWLDDYFVGARENMGGQAGIIANQMASLGAQSIVYTPLLSPKQGRLFVDGVTTPLVQGNQAEIKPVPEAVRRDDETKINWIFEYAKGETVRFGKEVVITPRANRVILATRPKGSVMSFDKAIRDHLPKLGKSIDVAFMAGYHYAEPMNVDGRTFEEFMGDSVADLHALKEDNPDLVAHFEYVPMKRPELEPKMLQAVCQEIKSFGINENEIKRVLREYGYEEEMEEIERHERAYSLYKGALRLFGHMELDRIHVHNLGYYVMILSKPYPVSMVEVRQSCLFASAVNAMKAKYGGYVQREQLAEAAELPLSDIGFAQLEGMVEELKKEHPRAEALLTDGYLEFADHYLVVTPAHIVPNPVSTVGMGDTISSSSYAAELAG